MTLVPSPSHNYCCARKRKPRVRTSTLPSPLRKTRAQKSSEPSAFQNAPGTPSGVKGTVVIKALRLLLAVLVFSPIAGAGDDSARFQASFSRIDDLVRATMRASKVPGVGMALTTRDGTLRVSTYGYANKDARAPVTPETLFGIGSIGKSFTAVASLELEEAHKLDMHEPIATYLPWFKPNSAVPVTMHHVLSHTAGFPNMRMELQSSLYQAYWLTEVPLESEPGRQFHYSSAGYDLASIVIAQLSHGTYREFIQQNIFDRLGMRHSEPVFVNAMRPRLAISYDPLYDDRPARMSDPLVVSNWFEYGGGAGSIGSTPGDLAIYLRMLLNRGQDPSGRILTEESFGLLTQHAVDRGPHHYYGYGIETTEQDGHTMIGHGGGQQGFRSYMLGDMDDGLGVVIFANSPAQLEGIARYSLKALRAALPISRCRPRRPSSLPRAWRMDRSTLAPSRLPPAGVSPEARDSKLLMTYKGHTTTLELYGKDSFLCDDPDFALFPLHFERQKNVVVEAFYGGDWYKTDRYQGPTQFDYPREWDAYPGHYRVSSRHHINFRIVLRKGKLWVIDAGGSELLLNPNKDGSF